MKLIKILENRGKCDSSLRNFRLDILELNDGNYIVIGTDITDIIKDKLPLNAKCYNYEKIVKKLRYIFTFSRKDIME